MATEEEPSDQPVRKKTPRQQLRKAMEHMRDYTTVPEESSNSGPPPSDPSGIPTQQDEPLPPDQPPPESTDQDAYGVPATYLPIRSTSTRPSSSSPNPERRLDPFQFGTRLLTPQDDIFSHNAWDHTAPDETYATFISTQIDFQRTHRVSDFDKSRFNASPAKWWDKFYSHNAQNFFKDRKWLVQEFPVLGQCMRAGRGEVKVLEVGAGAGNTVFPVMRGSRNEELRVWGVDYSAKAVEVMQKVWEKGLEGREEGGEGEAEDGNDGETTGKVGSPQQSSEPKENGTLATPIEPKGHLTLAVWDVTSPDTLPPGLTEGSLDVVVMIFIFSALEPSQWRQAVRNIYRLLKPGGQVLFRDYGRGDLAQVRFKKGRYLDENFYVRGDGTRVYFFEEEELRSIWSGEYFKEEDGEQAAGFEITNLAVDRRMLVNRQRRLKMYRCWMQGLFTKPLEDAT